MDTDIFDIYGDLEEFDTNEELKNVSENKMAYVLNRKGAKMFIQYINIKFECNFLLYGLLLSTSEKLINNNAICVGQNNHRGPSKPGK